MALVCLWARYATKFPMATELPTGTTIRLAVTRCGCDQQLLCSSAAMAPLLSQASLDSGLEPLEWVGHDFDGGGHTTCLLLAESHVTVHTYPETERTVMIEISICDYLRDNRQLARELARRLEALFQGQQARHREERW